VRGSDGVTIWHVLYNVPGGKSGALAVKAKFTQVTSPSPYAVEPQWTITRYQVVMSKVPHNTDLQRMYRVLQTRALEADEVAHMETLIHEYERETT
jgi:hypothetical protein